MIFVNKGNNIMFPEMPDKVSYLQPSHANVIIGKIECKHKDNWIDQNQGRIPMKKYKNCQICQKEFISLNDRHKYCGEGCRNAAKKISILRSKIVYEIDKLLGNI